MPFKIGDRVRIKTSDRNRVFDLEADLLCNLSDRTISSKQHDAMLLLSSSGQDLRFSAGTTSVRIRVGALGRTEKHPSGIDLIVGIW